MLICPDKRRPEENKDRPLLAYGAPVGVEGQGVGGIGAVGWLVGGGVGGREFPRGSAT